MVSGIVVAGLPPAKWQRMRVGTRLRGFGAADSEAATVEISVEQFSIKNKEEE